jgi:hypothetical protein
MAFSTEEKQKIVRVLGWPYGVIVTTSLDYNNVVNTKLSSTTTDSEEATRLLLSRLDSLDTQLEKALCRTAATQVGDIKMNADEIPTLRRERKRVIMELSEFLGIAYISNIGSGMSNVCV